MGSSKKVHTQKANSMLPKKEFHMSFLTSPLIFQKYVLDVDESSRRRTPCLISLWKFTVDGKETRHSGHSFTAAFITARTRTSQNLIQFQVGWSLQTTQFAHDSFLVRSVPLYFVH